MSTPTEILSANAAHAASPDNRLGMRYMRRGRAVKASRYTLSVRGVEMDVECHVTGAWLEATDVDDAEAPVCEVIECVEVAGVDITRLCSEELLEEIRQTVDAGFVR